MDNKNFFHNKTVDDLNIISDKLGRVIHLKKRDLEDIQEVQKKADVLGDYWKVLPAPLTPGAKDSFASGSALIHDFRSYVEGLEPGEFTGPVLGSIVASGDSMGSVGMTLFRIAPPPEPIRKELEVKFVEINNAPKRKERQKEVRSYLKRIAPHLTNMYDGAWENLESNFNDPARGAAFLMREVVSQVLDSLAPKKLIKAQRGFITDSTAKDGVTRRHRLEYIGNNLAKDATKKKLIESSTEAFLDNYRALCEAHERATLDKSKVESFLFQANDLLRLILSAIKLDQGLDGNRGRSPIT